MVYGKLRKTIYVASFTQIFKTTNGGNTWSQILNNAPANVTYLAVNPTNPQDVYVTELEIQYNTHKIYAATFGRGLWKSDLFVPTSATINANPSVICAGNSTQLTVSASGGTGSYSYSWSSNPAGFTSTLANPTVSPTVNTTYTVTITSGAESISSWV